MKKIAILGSTGSIGTQTLEVARENGDHQITALAAGNNIELLEKQIREFEPELAVLSDEAAYARLKSRYTGKTKLAGGRQAFIDAAAYPDVDTVVTSMMGFAGLEPTMKALDAKKNIALANKETLVVAGEIVMRRAKEQGVSILPVDSEHCAFFLYLCVFYNYQSFAAEIGIYKLLYFINDDLKRLSRLKPLVLTRAAAKLLLRVDEDDVLPDAHDALPRQHIIVLAPQQPEPARPPRRDERDEPPLRVVKLRVAHVAQPCPCMHVDDLFIPQVGKIADHKNHRLHRRIYKSMGAGSCTIPRRARRRGGFWGWRW